MDLIHDLSDGSIRNNKWLSKYIHLLAIIVAALIAISLSAASIAEDTSDSVVIRGQVANLGEKGFIWNNSNFAGFYQDIDENIGNEQIAFNLSSRGPNSATLSGQEISGIRGVTYKTSAQLKNFKFKGWGKYYVIGFLSEEYFVAYNNRSFLFNESKNSNLMSHEQIDKVLIDSNTEQTITSSNHLKLDEGYELAVKSVDNKSNKVYVDLSKDGMVIDSRIIKPSIPDPKMKDMTYVYKTNLGEIKDIIVMAVHFKNAFRSNDVNVATVDGIFQVSDSTTPVILDQQYDRMSIRNVDPQNLIITMDNKDKTMRLMKNEEIQLMQNIFIKTADQDEINLMSPLRYCIMKKYIVPDTYEMRGSVYNLSIKEANWTARNFCGFYYDIDNDIGSEDIIFRPTDLAKNDEIATLSDTVDKTGLRGILYRTIGQNKSLKFKPWGQYKVIGFLSQEFFAAYEKSATSAMKDAGLKVPLLADKSENYGNLLTNEQISKVLIDSDAEQTVDSTNPLELKEGYQLAIKSIDSEGGKISLELKKNGISVDEKVIQPSIIGSTMDDQTYFYKTSIGDSRDIVTIAVHFEEVFGESDIQAATINGIFQISEFPVWLKEQQYDNMSISDINPTSFAITMDNRNHPISLSMNKDILLMPNIHIKTADQNISKKEPLRYYIYRKAIVEE